MDTQTSLFRLDASAGDLHGENERLRAIGPAVRVRLPGGVPAWVITRHELLQELLADPRTAKDPAHWSAWRAGEVPEGWPLISMVTNPGMTTADGEEHRRLRDLVTQAFTARRVTAMRPRVEAITLRLLDALAERGGDAVDLRRHFAYPLPMAVIGDLLGVPEERFDEFRNLSVSLTSSVTPSEETIATQRRLHALLTDLVAARRERPGEDLTSHLIAARDDGDRLSEPELIGTLILVLVAGHGTTLNLITNATAALLTHPAQRAAVTTGRLPWDAVVEETLRWDSPVAHFPLRYALDDIPLGTVVIPRGEAILASYAAAGRDPGRFGADAAEFDIARPRPKHLSFGHGPHYCLGAALARLEAGIALPALFRRFPHLELAVPRAELVPVPSIVSNSVQTLPATLYGR
ncbi:cytochrome P450 family protein [Streptomyces spectabilis]|uniref:Cytochrome P450 n=1 Tax=Streptomyces spectabilis TaxID=68270 RepID=A0A516RJB2_STRST|nr:cytochrome P450 [Streptomyces spectabilis]QDQ15740.1 cytochrome P450 [Streptomyces spectabilis]